MPNIFVDYYYNCSHRQQSEFGDWYEDWDFYINSVHLNQPRYGQLESFTVEWTPEIGQKVYVLSIRYSDGDSFGSTSGKGEVMWVFSDRETAQRAAAALKNAGDNQQTVEIEVESGKNVRIQNTGYDCFTHVYSYDVDVFTVER